MRANAPVCLALAAALFAAATPLHAADYEDAVLAEINQVRADPRGYARELRHQLVRSARWGEEDGMAQEDPDAVEDAIGFLMRQPPLPPLSRDSRLARVARGHVSRQSRSGQTGHGAPGTLSRRLQAEGVYAGLQAESISYGQHSPRDVVRQLVVDSRVPNRGHRKDMFGRAYQVAGVACGPHARWGAMCVIEYAGAVVQR